MLTGGSGYVSPPRVEILGSGTGATAEAILQTDPTQPFYGQITDVNLINAGGYDNETTVRILEGLPLLTPTGERAVAIINTLVPALNSGSLITILHPGSGYVSAPK